MQQGEGRREGCSDWRGEGCSEGRRGEKAAVTEREVGGYGGRGAF